MDKIKRFFSSAGAYIGLAFIAILMLLKRRDKSFNAGVDEGFNERVVANEKEKAERNLKAQQANDRAQKIKADALVKVQADKALHENNIEAIVKELNHD